MILLVLQILGRVLCGVSANTVQKQMVNDGVPVGRLWLATYAWMLPFSLLLILTGASAGSLAHWQNAALAGALDAMGNLAMVAALRSTDLSIFGPLNALRPVVGLALGWMFLNEVPTTAGLVGVLLTVLGGVYLMAVPQAASARNQWNRRAGVIGWRIGGLLLSTVGAIYLKRAVLEASVGQTLGIWVLGGGVIVAVVACLRRGTGAALGSALKLSPRWMLLHAAFFFGMQFLTILIFQRTLMAYAFVFFQLGMVLQVLVGKMLFREHDISRRLLACLVMAAGGGLILWRGT